MPQVVSVEPENKRATSLRVSNRVLVQFAFDTTKTEAQQILKTANVNAEENSFLRYDEVVVGVAKGKETEYIKKLTNVLGIQKVQRLFRVGHD